MEGKCLLCSNFVFEANRRGITWVIPAQNPHQQFFVRDDMCHLLLQKWWFTPSSLLDKRQIHSWFYDSPYYSVLLLFSSTAWTLLNVHCTFYASALSHPTTFYPSWDIFSSSLTLSISLFLYCCVPQLNLSLELDTQYKSYFVHSIKRSREFHLNHIYHSLCVYVCVKFKYTEN